MPYISQSALDRIHELEEAVKEERATRDAQAAEHARQLLHCVNMLLRRGETFPIPPKGKEGAAGEKEGTAAPRPLSPIVPSKYTAIQQAATSSGRQMTDPEVVQWVKDETGFTPTEIEQRLQQQLSSGLTQ